MPLAASLSTRFFPADHRGGYGEACHGAHFGAGWPDSRRWPPPSVWELRTTGLRRPPGVADQVRSVGAQWLDLGTGAISAAGEGDTPRELTGREPFQQQKKLEQAIGGFDVVITTALGTRPAGPEAGDRGRREGMKPGSVVVTCWRDRRQLRTPRCPGETAAARRHDCVAAEPASDHARACQRALPKNLTSLLELLIRDGALAPISTIEVIGGLHYA